MPNFVGLPNTVSHIYYSFLDSTGRCLPMYSSDGYHNTFPFKIIYISQFTNELNPDFAACQVLCHLILIDLSNIKH